MKAFSKVGEPGAATLVSVGKDAVALLRDAALFFLGVLLVVFPGKFNTILVDAGFEEGSIVGFTWKSKLVESDRALQKARTTILQLQSKNDELVQALGEASGHAKDPKLGQLVGKLENENRQLKDATQQVQAAVSQTIETNGPLVEKALSSNAGGAADTRPKSDFSVGLQTLGVSDEERQAINDKLSADGYSLDPLTYSYPAGQRPTWFAPRSTVFYYAASARPMAEGLARFMKNATGQDYAVQKGAGLGVDPGRRNVTLFVHYVKS